MDNWVIEQNVELAQGAQVRVWPNALMLLGDKKAHTINLHVYSFGVPATLDGVTVSAYFLRNDGETVLVTGSASGNAVSVTLAQECYAYAGDLTASVRLTSGETTLTLCVMVLKIRQTASGAIVDPGTVIPGIDDVLAKMDEMDAAVKAAQTAVEGAEGAVSKAAASAEAAAASEKVVTDNIDTIAKEVTAADIYALLQTIEALLKKIAGSDGV